MNKFFNMTISGLLLSALLSASAFATEMKCTFEKDRTYTATIKFHEEGDFMEEIRIQSEEVDKIIFSFEDSKGLQVSSFAVSENDLKTNVDLIGLQRYAKLGKKKYNKVDFQAVTPAGEAEGDIKDVTDYIFDDGAGMALLRFRDVKNKFVGATLFLGWYGIFNKCK